MDAVINEVELLPPLSPLPATPPASKGSHHDCLPASASSGSLPHGADDQEKSRYSESVHAVRTESTRTLAAGLSDTPVHTACYIAAELQHLRRSNTKLQQVNVALTTEVSVLTQQAKDMVHGTQQIFVGVEVVTQRLDTVGDRLGTVATHLLSVTNNLASVGAALQDCCEHLPTLRSPSRSSSCSTCSCSRS